MKQIVLNPDSQAYVSPYAEIVPVCPERVLCLSGESEPEDYDVIDYAW